MSSRAEPGEGGTARIKQIRLNAFAANGPVHLSPGLWTHPDDTSLQYKTIDFWLDLARLLEKGKFDALFLADGSGVNDVHGGTSENAVRLGAQIPRGDPFVLVPAMAAVTRNLGFGVTGNVSYEPCVPFARRLTTLDHITGGRFAWNVVTGFLKTAARAQGNRDVVAHDDRYDIAEEYMEVMYKLWEGSWEDGAMLADRATGQFADPDKVHRIEHNGRHFSVEALFMSEPSPQRTPLLFQAGASDRGRAFAARHAECVFVSGPSRQVIAPIVADIRARTKAAGRDPQDILFFSLMTVIVGRTEAEAWAKFEDYKRHVSFEGALTMLSGWTGIDLSTFDPDAPIPYILKDAAMRSAIESFTVADPGRVWTLREVATHNTIGGRGPVVIGDPRTVADELLSWMADTDVDGFNLSYATMPADFSSFVDLVVPELQARGVYKRDYSAGPLREKLFGTGRARVAKTHPASLHRAPSQVERIDA